MSTSLRLFWVFVFVCVALLLLSAVASVMHVTIEFGAPREVYRLGSIESEIMRALPSQKMNFLRDTSPAGFGVTKKAVRLTVHSAAPLGVAAPRNPFAGRFRGMFGRVFSDGAQSDAGSHLAQSCRPAIFSHPMHEGAARVCLPVIRDGRERGLNPNA